jgi:hypothetical protein
MAELVLLVCLCELPLSLSDRRQPVYGRPDGTTLRPGPGDRQLLGRFGGTPSI